jgi:hypothetical protein
MDPLERRIKKNGKVDLWDCGPTRPLAPEAPVEPDDKKLKGADLAAAQVEHEDNLERYKQQLRDYAAAKRAYLEWHDEKGGPIKIELWGIDARHALNNFPERWKLDLPRGQKPGRAQIEAEEMAEAEANDLNRARASDPQFGQRATA